MDLGSIFTNALELMVNTFVVAIPNLVKALLILAIGYFISRSIYGFISLILRKAGVDQYLSKLEQIELVAKSGISIRISDVVAKIIYVFLLLIFLVAATDILAMPALSQLVASAIGYIPSLIIAILILVFGMLGADALRKLTFSIGKSFGISGAKLISTFVFYFLFITVVMMALSQAKVDIKFMSTNLSILIAGSVFAVALGYGLAAKETAANHLAARYSKGKFQPGDKIEMDNTHGTIVRMDAESITLENEESITVIPMHMVMNNKVKILK